MSYLEEFVNSVNYLPGEVCRSLELLKLLDEKTKTVSEESFSMSTDYFATLKKEQGAVLENTDLLLLIRDRHQKAFNYSEEKVAVAKQLLDMVEFHLSKLKQDLDIYKKEISVDMEIVEERNLKKTKFERNNLIYEGDMGMCFDGLDMQDDMQAEDNKVYCYCGKGSYGEMIECEGPKVRNMQCKRGWFHMECAGLTARPIGSWFCQDCEEDKKRGAMKNSK